MISFIFRVALLLIDAGSIKRAQTQRAWDRTLQPDSDEVSSSGLGSGGLDVGWLEISGTFR